MGMPLPARMDARARSIASSSSSSRSISGCGSSITRKSFVPSGNLARVMILPFTTLARALRIVQPAYHPHPSDAEIEASYDAASSTYEKPKATRRASLELAENRMDRRARSEISPSSVILPLHVCAASTRAVRRREPPSGSSSSCCLRTGSGISPISPVTRARDNSRGRTRGGSETAVEIPASAVRASRSCVPGERNAAPGS
jgi:hypothetical protein